MTLIDTVQASYPIGSEAIDFNLPGIDTQDYNLESFKDKEVLIIVFTCNHCPFAQGYFPRLIKIQEDYKDKRVQLVGINPNDSENYPDDSFEAMKPFAEEYGINFPYLRDESQETAKAYHAACTPDIFVFDKERKLRYRGKIDETTGAINEPGYTPEEGNEHYLRDALDAILEGTEIETPEIPVIGCSIKWKTE